MEAGGAATSCITGRVVARRLLGKHLAFAVLRPDGSPAALAPPVAGVAAVAEKQLTKKEKRIAARAAAAGAGAGAAAAEGEGAADRNICFRRRGDDGVDLWDEASAALFPAKRSLLQVGSRVTVEVLPGDPPAVVRWTVLEQGGGRATGRIPTDSAPLALGADLGAAADAASGVCGAWALLGACGSSAGASTSCCPYRHAFASEQEKATAQKLRARQQRQASVAEKLVASLHARWELQRPGALVRYGHTHPICSHGYL